MKLLIKLWIFYSLFCLMGCQEVDYKTFNDKNRIVMNSVKEVTHNFCYQDRNTVTRDTVFLEVRAIGMPCDYDREIKLKQVKEYETVYQYDADGNVTGTVYVLRTNVAEPGVHYVALDDPEMEGKLVIPAHTVITKIPVILLRKDEILRKQEMRIRLQLEETEDFALGDNVRLANTIIFSDRLGRPKKWTKDMESLFGKYSVRKHEFMISVSGQQVDDDWIKRGDFDYAYWETWNLVFAKALEEFNADPVNRDSGKAPMKDEQGDFIDFP